MRRTLVLTVGFGLLGLALPILAPGEAPDPQAVAQQRLAALSVHSFPGVAYAVVAQDEVTEIGATGVKRRGYDEPITADTPFPLASISKSFTALAVVQLAEAGKLSLDDPIARHLPAFADRASGAITIRQLISHTSGFSTYQGLLWSRYSTAGGDVIARRADELAAMDPAYGPEERWEYSNANYQVLGRLIEVVSGQSFQDYIETAVLQPIGMGHSFVGDGEIHAEMATAHLPWFGTKRPAANYRIELGSAPQGGIVASANDLARYMQFMMNGRDDVISARAKTEMMSAASDASPFYGFGWFLDGETGTVSHSGYLPGGETRLTMMPAKREGVVVLLNGSSGIGFGEAAPLLDGITNDGLGFGGSGNPSRWAQKATYLSVVLLPFIFLLSMVWAWRHRDALRAKAGPSGGFSGLFSLWFPLLTTLGVATIPFLLIPLLFNQPFATVRLYHPDFALALIACGVTGVLWALFRLSLAYTGKRAALDSGTG